MALPNYILRLLLNEFSESDNLASFGSWLQIIAPLYLKLFLGTPSSVWEVFCQITCQNKHRKHLPTSIYQLIFCSLRIMGSPY